MNDASRDIESLLLDAVLQIGDEPTRRAFLDQTCAGHPEMRGRLEEYLGNGGALIASYRSGLDPAGQQFALPLGVRLKGDAPFSPDFVRARPALGKGLPAGELVPGSVTNLFKELRTWRPS